MLPLALGGAARQVAINNAARSKKGQRLGRLIFRLNCPYRRYCKTRLCLKRFTLFRGREKRVLGYRSRIATSQNPSRIFVSCSSGAFHVKQGGLRQPGGVGE